MGLLRPPPPGGTLDGTQPCPRCIPSGSTPGGCPSTTGSGAASSNSMSVLRSKKRDARTDSDNVKRTSKSGVSRQDRGRGCALVVYAEPRHTPRAVPTTTRVKLLWNVRLWRVGAVGFKRPQAVSECCGKRWAEKGRRWFISHRSGLFRLPLQRENLECVLLVLVESRVIGPRSGAAQTR